LADQPFRSSFLRSSYSGADVPKHENFKYLPDIPLPSNLIATPSLEESVEGASILIFNLPHQFIGGLCDQMKGHILPYARGISCIKGVDVSSKDVHLFSESIGEKLGIYKKNSPKPPSPTTLHPWTPAPPHPKAPPQDPRN